MTFKQLSTFLKSAEAAYMAFVTATRLTIKVVDQAKRHLKQINFSALVTAAKARFS